VSDYFICPHCGAEVDYDAPACPECGSDDETGWSEETAYDGLYLDDDEPLPKPGWFTTRTKTILAGLAFATLALFLMALFPGGFYWALAIGVIIGLVYYAKEIWPDTPSQVEKRLYADLLTKARGDADMVERWIEYEQRRSLNANRIELMEDAIQRWEWDNR
jgi:hypothetical protein